MNDQRPDPELLLARIEAEESKASRGKLKIFFGASPGVGKTYAMLCAARTLKSQGIDLVVGVLETHGRSETAELLEGLEILPLRKIEYKNHILSEFDLDAALQRKPRLILVDELAHSNVTGARHTKRWQDVEELLMAGIDVFSTVNVQHLDSLNDVVGGITGTRVWEKLPDKVFDRADEVVLVDLPPDELLERLKQGKVYFPATAERAMQNFFRKGNLLSLRELALRRTAERVDVQVLAYRRENAVSAVWSIRESLLVCIGTGPGGEKLIRSAARMANRYQVPWHVLYVETYKNRELPEATRSAVLKKLKFAQELGAITSTLPGEDAATVAISYAREHNLGKVVVGSHLRYGLPFRRGFAEELRVLAPEFDIIQIAQEENGSEGKFPTVSKPRASEWNRNDLLRYGIGFLAVLTVTALTAPLHAHLDLVNISMLFLLAVVFSAIRLGRGPAVLVAVLSVASFDFFYVDPRLSFAVSDVQYLVTFAVMLAVALIVGQLTAGLKFQASVAEKRELRNRGLYEMAKELASSLTVEQIAEVGTRSINRAFNAESTILVPAEEERLGTVPGFVALPEVDVGIAQWTFDHAEAAGLSTDTLPASTLLYLPLKASMRIRGVVAFKPNHRPWAPSPEQERLLDTSVTLIAIALERVHYTSVAQEALLRMESERLRTSLLSAISHDLKTPITALIGLAETLKRSLSPESSQRHSVQAIHEEALRMKALVTNLLEMARLQEGNVRLNLDWQHLEETVYAAYESLEELLSEHQVDIDLPFDLQLLRYDALLMERVFCNLFENAAKYTPKGSRIAVSAKISGERMEVLFEDNGPGIPPGKEEVLFEKFMRGKQESSIAGVGLGLAIVRAVINAHGGSIKAENRPQGGARFIMSLPAEPPPPLPEEEDF